MERKIVSGIILTLFLLISMLTLAFNIQPARASGTIYIRADGSIDPPTAPISTFDNVTYTLTGNITSDNNGVVVERDNIVIDGDGLTLQGARAHYEPNSIGIDLSGRENVTVRNTQITTFECDIFLNYSSNCRISGNNITNGYWGINSYPYRSDHNSIDGNNITNNGYGMMLFISPYSNVSENNITNNGFGIELDYSSNCSISGNTFVADGLYVVGSYLDSYLNSVENNTVNAKPLVYLESVADYSVGDAGQVILVNCDNIRVENLNLSQATIGLQLLETNNTIISGNNITYNSESGIWLASSSSYNSVSGNNITGNWNGVSLIGASYNSISGNNIAGNGFGIWLLSSSYNSVSGNNIAASGHCGIDLQSSSSNSIIGNNITAGFDYGSILLWYSSSDNKFYHNNIINNSRQVYIEDLANVWDDGYPSGGNYWSDYVGVDIKKGPTQDQHGSDNIGDTPYAINTDNVDHYPLMNPYGSPPPPTYSLTITTTAGGTTNPPPGTYTYSQGQTVPVQATPNIGYVFAHWELDSTNVSLTNPISVLMDENHALHVVFVGMNYTLQITTTVGGMTTPAPGLHTYMNGTEVAITAIPSNNYMFDHWELDGASIGSNNPVTITMDANHTLHAVFRAHIFEELYMKGPYYTQYGVQYWIVRFGNGRGMRLVSNYY